MKYLLYLVMLVIGGQVMAQDVQKIPVTPQQKKAAPHKKASPTRKSSNLSSRLSETEKKKRAATKQKNLQRTLKEKNFHIPDSAKHK